MVESHRKNYPKIGGIHDENFVAINNRFGVAMRNRDNIVACGTGREARKWRLCIRLVTGVSPLTMDTPSSNLFQTTLSDLQD